MQCPLSPSTEHGPGSPAGLVCHDSDSAPVHDWWILGVHREEGQ